MRILDGGADSVISEDFVAKSVSGSRGEALQAGMPAFPSAVAASREPQALFGIDFGGWKGNNQPT